MLKRKRLLLQDELTYRRPHFPFTSASTETAIPGNSNLKIPDSAEAYAVLAENE